MSTIKVSNIQNASTSSGGIAIDTSGHVTVDGVAYPSAGSLSGRNRIINGDMRIDQRNAGASVSSGGFLYTVDRWQTYEASSGQFTIQRSTIAPADFTNSLLFTVTTAQSSLNANDQYIFQQYVEGFNSADLNWGTASAKAITVSFWVRSSVIGTYPVAIINGSSNRSYVTTFTINTANTWEYKTATIPGDTTGSWSTDNSTGIMLRFCLGGGSDFNATANAWNGTYKLNTSSSVNLLATNGATFYITGVQLEAGTVATPFERRSYGQELSLCQRYFEVYSGSDFFLLKLRESDRLRYVTIPFKTTKRASATCTLINSNTDGSGAITATGGIDGCLFISLATSDGQAPRVTSFSAASEL